jgi:hypothetical protein
MLARIFANTPEFPRFISRLIAFLTGHPPNTLTPFQENAAYTLGNLGGLSLNVSAHGGNSRHFRDDWLGGPKRISLDPCPEISLRQARLSRDEARALLARGVDPRARRKRERPTARLADENAFRVVGAHWMERRKREIKAGKGGTHAGMVSVLSLPRPSLLIAPAP